MVPELQPVGAVGRLVACAMRSEEGGRTKEAKEEVEVNGEGRPTEVTPYDYIVHDYTLHMHLGARIRRAKLPRARAQALPQAEQQDTHLSLHFNPSQFS